MKNNLQKTPHLRAQAEARAMQHRAQSSARQQNDGTSNLVSRARSKLENTRRALAILIKMYAGVVLMFLLLNVTSFREDVFYFSSRLAFIAASPFFIFRLFSALFKSAKGAAVGALQGAGKGSVGSAGELSQLERAVSGKGFSILLKVMLWPIAAIFRLTGWGASDTFSVEREAYDDNRTSFVFFKDPANYRLQRQQAINKMVTRTNLAASISNLFNNDNITNKRG